MNYDLFTSVPEPKINISLFGDAASQGAKVGSAIPTTTTAVIQGLQQGISQGLDWQTQAENIETADLQQQRLQQQIESEPEILRQQEELRQLQIDHAKNVAKLDENKIELALLTQSNDAKTAVMESENALIQAKQKKADIETQESISKDITNANAEVRKSVLQNPKYADFMLRNPKFAEGVLGAIQGDLTEEEKQTALARLDFIKKMELDAERKQLGAKADAEIVKNYEKAAKELTDPDLGIVVKDKSPDALARLEVVPAGTYTVDRETKQKDLSKPGIPSPNAGYDVFDGNTFVNHINSHAAANKLVNWQGAYLKQIELLEKRLGVPKGTVTKTQAETPAASTPAAPTTPKPRTMPELVGASKLPQDKATSILGKAQQAGLEASWFERNAPMWLQSTPVEKAFTETINATPESEEIKAAITETATQQTNETLTKLKSGTAEEKQDLRDWADAQGIELTRSSLHHYYRQTIQDALNTSYEEAFNLGIAEQAKQNRIQASRSAAAELDKEALKGKTAEEAMAIKKTAREQVSSASTAASSKPASTQPNITVGGDIPPFGAQYTGSAAVPGVQGVPASVAAVATLGPRTVKAAKDLFNFAATQLGLRPSRTKDLESRVVGVLTNPYLADAPSHVKAIGAVESGGKEGAVSPTGVKGLMQVTRKVAGSYGLNRNIPEENVEAGTRYLNDLIKMFQGEKALAYAAYNAGPGVIKYAQKLANGSTDWQEVKKYLYEALVYYKDSIGVDPAAKLKEVFNYPEKVMLHEAIFEAEKRVA